MFFLLKVMTLTKGKVDSVERDSAGKKSLLGMRESAGFFLIFEILCQSYLHTVTNASVQKKTLFFLFDIHCRGGKRTLLFHAYFPAMKFLIFLPLSSLDLKKKRKKKRRRSNMIQFDSNTACKDFPPLGCL